jgi:quercetin dioxygenase-like cupin family protein/DNA-binding XRE family transcriptional regulator
MHADARARLRRARQDAGLSLRELGRRVGVSASLLSQIEQGRSDPSVSSLYALVSALHISLDELLDGAGKPSAWPSVANDRVSSPVVRPAERAVLDMDSGVRWERLTHGPHEQVDALLVTYQPGGRSSSTGRLMTHDGVEFAYLVEGELILHLGFEEHLFRAGDSLTFNSAAPHMYINAGSVPAVGVWYVVRRRDGGVVEDSYRDEQILRGT